MEAYLVIEGAAAIALLYAAWRARLIAAKAGQDPRAAEIAQAVSSGGLVWLNREYRILAMTVAGMALLMWMAQLAGNEKVMIPPPVIISFIIGSALSAAAGKIGMRVASKGGKGQGFAAAFSSGSVLGFSAVGLGLLGVTVLWRIFGDPNLIYGFGLGASAVALFARVGGGIFMKAAETGADLAAQGELGIPADDLRNPAAIAEKAGVNAGRVAGMGADLFESYIGTLIAAMVIGVATLPTLGETGAIYPLGIAAIGILASIFGVTIILKRGDNQISSSFNKGIYATWAVLLGGVWWWTNKLFSGDMKLFGTVLTGLLAGAAFGIVTGYFSSRDKRPVQSMAGLARGMFSTAAPMAIVGATILVSYQLYGTYGMAIAAVGMMSTLGITLTANIWSPIAEMNSETREGVEEFDAVGKKREAIGRGYATGAAVLTALVLFAGYIAVTGITAVDVLKPEVLAGLLIGGVLPFVFAAFSMEAVGKSAKKMAAEARRQFREIAGIGEERNKPDYKACTEIAATEALKGIRLPGLLAVLVPVLTGFALGAEALGGLLAGGIVTGFLLAVMMANSGGKGSDGYRAMVAGDTTGQLFWDASGPALNTLIKFMPMAALIIAPLL